MSLFRSLNILRKVLRSGVLLDLPPIAHSPWKTSLLTLCESARHRHQSKALRLRELLETLGPIPVKFGQILSTRPDLIGLDYASELSKLQDQVPPFDGEIAKAQVARALESPLSDHFQDFEDQAIASASIAQVHFATLINGDAVAIKILRPNIHEAIKRDVDVLRFLARWFHRLWKDGRLLRLPEVVEEFARHLQVEIDLMFEAANAAQLRRNFERSSLMYVPKVYFDLCRSDVMVSERINGLPINQHEKLRAANINLKKLSTHGTEIFFTQVFRDGFFHADMHPGNIFVLADGRYCAVDFGIMGTLSINDKMYLAQNFLAFFNRDYRKVAIAHVEAGWAPRHTNIEAFTGAIRAACEPIFDKPIKDISFGKLLLRLFQISRRFGVEEQPQLVMLQKTLFNIEGLGRELDPDLDLWAVAQPFLEKWMREQLGFRAFWRKAREEAPYWASTLPELPRRLHQHLSLQVEALEEAKHLSYKGAISSRNDRTTGRFLIGLLLITNILLMLVLIGLVLIVVWNLD